MPVVGSYAFALSLSSYNSSVASKIAKFFNINEKLSSIHQKYMKECVQKILSKPNISESTKEILSYT